MTAPADPSPPGASAPLPVAAPGSRPDPAADDRVLATSRALAIGVIPFLVAATILLWGWPERTGLLFAWPIKPSMTALMLGAAYLGGIYFFAQVIRARRWHEVQAGFLPVCTFATLLGVATVLHWNRFTPGHVSFLAWAGLYLTAPELVLAAWLVNRRRDPGRREPGDPAIPAPVAQALRLAGIGVLAISLLLFVWPGLMVALWPWRLSPLTARVMSAMFSLPGIVFLGIAGDPRWSSARAIIQSQLLSIAIILAAAARAWGDFQPAGPAAFLFVGGLGGMAAALLWLHVAMDARRETAR